MCPYTHRVHFWEKTVFKCKNASPDISLKSAGVVKFAWVSGPGLGCTFPDINNNKTVKHFCLRDVLLKLFQFPWSPFKMISNTRRNDKIVVKSHDTAQTNEVQNVKGEKTMK